MALNPLWDEPDTSHADSRPPAGEPDVNVSSTSPLVSSALGADNLMLQIPDEDLQTSSDEGMPGTLAEVLAQVPKATKSLVPKLVPYVVFLVRLKAVR